MKRKEERKVIPMYPKWPPAELPPLPEGEIHKGAPLDHQDDDNKKDK